MTYLGGVIYGSYGSVADTEFYAKVEGNYLYLSTLERYENGFEPLVVADLTGGGQYEVYQSGYTGVLSWNDNVPYDLEISYFAN